VFPSINKGKREEKEMGPDNTDSCDEGEGIGKMPPSFGCIKKGGKGRKNGT